MAINNSASPNEVRLALAFANYLTKPEQQLEGLTQTQSFLPVNRQVVVGEKLLPIGSVLVEQAKTAIAIPLDDLHLALPLFEVGEALYQQAIAGTLSPEEAARQLKEAVLATPKTGRALLR
jgi:ABC-type glycerol-3-phosphate transport system substrate-binding protein